MTWLPVVLWLAALVGAAVVVASARFTTDMSAFLPAAPTAGQRVLIEQLRAGPAAQLLLLGIDGGDAAARAAISNRLAAALRADRHFSMVQNGAAAETAADFSFLFGNRYVLSSGVTPQKFSTTGLHDAIAASIAQLATPAGDALAPLLPADPTGETLTLLGSLQASGGPANRDGVWSAADGRRALLIARTLAEAGDLDGQAAAMAAAQADFAAATRAGGQAKATRLLLSGAGVFAVQARATIRHGAEMVSMIGGGLITLLLLLIYRAPLLLLLGLLPVLTGVLAGIAAVSLAFGTVNGITLGFGTSLMGEAVDYAIYLFTQAGAAPGAVLAWRHEAWPTIRLGLVVSLCGFATLLASDFPGLAQLGLYSIAGLISAALVTRFVLPQLLPAGLAVRDLSGLGSRLAQLAVAAQRWRLPAVVLVAAAAILLVAERRQLWNHSLQALSPVSPAVQALDADLRSGLGAPDAGDLVVAQGGSAQQALRRAEAAGLLLGPLVGQGVIAGFTSPAQFLPSQALQMARLAALPPPPELAARLPAALVGLPLQAARLAPFLHDVAAARQAGPIGAPALAGTSFAATAGLLTRQGEQWTALILLQAAAGKGIDPDRLARVFNGPAGPALFINIRQATDALYARYLGAAIRLSLAGVAAIILLLALVLRRPVRLLRVLTPLAAAVLVTAAMLVAAGEKLTLLHLVGLMLTVAVGSNYALFFERHAVSPRIMASLACANACTVAGFGPLIVSGVPVLQALGATVAPGTLLALVFSALMAPAPPSNPEAASHHL